MPDIGTLQDQVADLQFQLDTHRRALDTVAFTLAQHVDADVETIMQEALLTATLTITRERLTGIMDDVAKGIRHGI